MKNVLSELKKIATISAVLFIKIYIIILIKYNFEKIGFFLRNAC